MYITCTARKRMFIYFSVFFFTVFLLSKPSRYFCTNVLHLCTLFFCLDRKKPTVNVSNTCRDTLRFINLTDVFFLFFVTMTTIHDIDVKMVAYATRISFVFVCFSLKGARKRFRGWKTWKFIRGATPGSDLTCVSLTVVRKAFRTVPIVPNINGRISTP